MEYASPVWDLSTSKDQYALERVQRRAARWITSSYDRTTSVTKLPRQLNLEPLDKRRRIHRLTFLYNVLNEHVAVPPDKLDIKQNGSHVRGSVTKQRLVIPRCRFNKIAIQGTPQMAVDKEALICLSRVYSYYFKCNFPLFYVYPALTRYLSILFFSCYS